MRTLLVIGLLAGCHGDDSTTTPDAVTPGPMGLELRWMPDPLLPGPISTDLTVTRAEFGFSRISVVGDAGPGDPRTTMSHVTPVWDASTRPAPVPFEDAPAGLYSQVVLDLDGDDGDHTFEITGTVMLATPMPFRVVDNQAQRIAVACEVLVADRALTAAALGLDAEKLLTEIDFSTARVVGGVIVVDHTDAQILEVRQALSEVFDVSDDDL